MEGVLAIIILYIAVEMWSKEMRARRVQAVATLRGAGPVKVTLVAIGGVLAVIIPQQLTADDALHVRVQVEQVVWEAGAADRVYSLDNDDLGRIHQRRTVPADPISAEEVERVANALEAAGYDVAITSDPKEVEAAYEAEDPLVDDLGVDEDDARGMGFRGILLKNGE